MASTWFAFLLPLSVAIICGVQVYIALKWGVIKGMGQILVRKGERPQNFKTNLIGLAIGFLFSLAITLLMLAGFIRKILG